MGVLPGSAAGTRGVKGMEVVGGHPPMPLVMHTIRVLTTLFAPIQGRQQAAVPVQLAQCRVPKHGIPSHYLHSDLREPL